MRKERVLTSLNRATKEGVKGNERIAILAKGPRENEGKIRTVKLWIPLRYLHVLNVVICVALGLHA